MKKVITVGVGDTVTIPVTQRKELCVLKCFSQNTMIAVCNKGERSVSITGCRPGTTVVAVIVGSKQFGPVAQVMYIVRVVEEDEE